MSPPKLPWNAPVSNSIHPKVPCFLKLLWNNLQFFWFYCLYCFSCHVITTDIPLGFNHRFHNILWPMIIKVILRKKSKQYLHQWVRNDILLPKLFWPTVRKNCSRDREKLLKVKAEGREFAKTCSWRFLRSNKLEQLEFKLEKIIMLPEIVLTFHCLNKLFKWSQKFCKFSAFSLEFQKFF